MRKILLALFFLWLLPAVLQAKDGYNIKLGFSDIRDATVYLAHYYSKPAPIYKVDSVRLDDKGLGILSTQEKIIGGIYIILLPGNVYFEFLLNNGDEISITATAADLPGSIAYAGSPENERFQKYNLYQRSFGTQQQSYQAELAKLTDKNAIAVLRDKMNKSISGLSDYRTSYIRQYSGTLLSNIFKATIIPKAPAGKHFLSSGREDTLYAFYYIKDHYWDNVDFSDERLTYTPILGSRLTDYINNYTVHTADSVGKVADLILDKAKGDPEMKKYILGWFTQYALESQTMGMDELFIYLVENYYMKGFADWMTKEQLDKYSQRAQQMAPNVIGSPAPPINMVDINKKDIPLASIDAKYTLVIFWAPDCGGCLKEVPVIDSLYRSNLKARGLKIYAVNVSDNEELWTKMIKEKNLSPDWIHVYDPEEKSTYKADYDVYGTPSIYLLDKNKIIRGKRLDHTNISYLVDILERRDKSN